MENMIKIEHIVGKWLDRDMIGKTEFYLVGGTVRDILSGEKPKDIDITCRNAKEIALEISKKKNAAFVPLEKKPDEPCYRVVDRNDISSFIDISEMRGKTIEEDLSKRDFTINSGAIEVSSGKIIDPFQSEKDLKEKIIRMTYSKCFSDDPLRILRAFRFSSVFELKIENSTLKHLTSYIHLLPNVSPERIMSEIYLILATTRSNSAFREMDKLGILDIIFPEIVPMKKRGQDGFHHLDVWEHSLFTMENTEGILNNLSVFFGAYGDMVSKIIDTKKRQLLKLSALLHDIGKPSTKAFDSNKDKITFYGHDKEGAKIFLNIARRLKLSRADTEFIFKMIAEHINALNLAVRRVKKLSKLKWFRKMNDNSIAVLILSIADVMSSQGKNSASEIRDGLILSLKKIIFDYFDWIKAKISAPNLITGDDIIKLGIEQGPEIGRIIRKIREAQDRGEIKKHEEAVYLAEQIIKHYNENN